MVCWLGEAGVDVLHRDVAQMVPSNFRSDVPPTRLVTLLGDVLPRGSHTGRKIELSPPGRWIGAA
jgi:hypothetical protein